MNFQTLSFRVAKAWDDGGVKRLKTDSSAQGPRTSNPIWCPDYDTDTDGDGRRPTAGGHRSSQFPPIIGELKDHKKVMGERKKIWWE